MLADEGLFTSCRCRLSDDVPRPARFTIPGVAAALFCVLYSLMLCTPWPPQPVYAASDSSKSAAAPPRPTLEHAKSLIETHQEGAAIVTL